MTRGNKLPIGPNVAAFLGDQLLTTFGYNVDGFVNGLLMMQDDQGFVDYASQLLQQLVIDMYDYDRDEFANFLKRLTATRGLL